MSQNTDIVSATFVLSDGSEKVLRLPRLGGVSSATDSPEKQALVAPISDAQYRFSINSDYECTYGLPKSIKLLTSNELLLFYIASVLSARDNKRLRIITELYLQEYILQKYQGENNIMKRFIILAPRLGVSLEEFILKEMTTVTFNGLCGFLNRKTRIRYNGKQLTLKEYIEHFQIVYHVRRKKKPTKLVRRKGYKDHGSLGSEYTRTLREQASTEEFQKIARESLVANIERQFPEAVGNSSLLYYLSDGQVGS